MTRHDDLETTERDSRVETPVETGGSGVPGGSASATAVRECAGLLAPGPARVAWALLALVLLVGAGVRFALVERSLPYPGHFDERWISQRVVYMMQRRTANPHAFRKPALPVYLAAAGFAWGAWTSGIRAAHRIGNVGYPYYASPRVVRPARLLFAATSVAGLALTGVLAAGLAETPAALPLGAAVLSLSGFYLHLSWKYLNPDIVGCALALATLAAILRRGRRERLGERALVPGALAGLAVASKYHLAVLALPGLAAILLLESPSRLRDAVWFGVAALAAFLAASPYTLLDFSAFLSGFLGQVAFYGPARVSGRSAPFWARCLRPAREVVRDFGVGSAPLALLGLGAASVRDWRRALVLASFPLGLAVLMALFRMYYARNLVALYPLYAAAVAAGLVSAWRWLVARADAAPPSDAVRPSLRRLAAAVVAGACLLATVPPRTVRAAYDLSGDSRNVAVRWIRENVPAGATILVPRELEMNPRRLRGAYRVVEFSLETDDLQGRARADEELVLLPQLFASRRKERERCALIRRRAAAFRGEVVLELGRHPLAIGYPRPVAAGDPAFRILRLQGGS